MNPIAIFAKELDKDTSITILDEHHRSTTPIASDIAKTYPLEDRYKRVMMSPRDHALYFEYPLPFSYIFMCKLMS
ncbi:MAG: hypothetical protein QXV82_00520 [Ignisphaera sp.]